MRSSYDLYDDDDCEVKDGESVSCPVFLMDTTPVADADLGYHRPGYRDAASKSAAVADLDSLRDAARRARSRWIGRMCDAWRTPPSVVAGPGQQRQTDPSQIGQSALSERRVGHEPDDSSSLAQWHEHMRGPDDDEHDIGAAARRHQRSRDLAWNDYKSRLSSAYLQGRRDPAAHARTFDPTASHTAARIEAQREKWTAER
jgi:hypothetical protein